MPSHMTTHIDAADAAHHARHWCEHTHHDGPHDSYQLAAGDLTVYVTGAPADVIALGHRLVALATERAEQYEQTTASVTDDAPPHGIVRPTTPIGDPT